MTAKWQCVAVPKANTLPFGSAQVWRLQFPFPKRGTEMVCMAAATLVPKTQLKDCDSLLGPSDQGTMSCCTNIPNPSVNIRPSLASALPVPIPMNWNGLQSPSCAVPYNCIEGPRPSDCFFRLGDNVLLYLSLLYFL